MVFFRHKQQAGQPAFHQVAKTARVVAAICRDPRPLITAWRLNELYDLPSRFGIFGARFAFKPYRPFGCAHWSPDTKLQRMATHFSLLEALGGLMLPVRGEPRRLADLPIADTELWVAIDEMPTMMQDGLCVFSLMQGDMRIFHITFTLSESRGALEAYIGGIQGRSGELDLYRDLTKAAHGVRPRDLAIQTFRYFCHAIGVRRIRAVAENATYHSDPYFGAHPYLTPRMNYDEIWSDRGGTRIDDGWFDLPLESPNRDVEDIPARKRAMYRRRYAMLDDIRSEIGHAVRAKIPGATISRQWRSKPRPVTLRKPAHHPAQVSNPAAATQRKRAGKP